MRYKYGHKVATNPTRIGGLIKLNTVCESLRADHL